MAELAALLGLGEIQSSIARIPALLHFAGGSHGWNLVGMASHGMVQGSSVAFGGRIPFLTRDLEPGICITVGGKLRGVRAAASIYNTSVITVLNRGCTVFVLSSSFCIY